MILPKEWNNNINGREVVIWGIGEAVPEVISELHSYGISNINFFISRDWHTTSKFMGRDVYGKQTLNKEKHFVVIGSLRYSDDIKEELLQLDFSEDMDFAIYYKTKYEKVYTEIKKHINLEGKCILEVGAGRGDFTRYMAEVSGAEYVNAIEYDLDIWKTESSSGPNWKITQGDVRELLFDDNSFDYVVSIFVFEHINGLSKALLEIERTLKPGGKCFAHFTPIWSSILGNHCDLLSPRDLSVTPPWGHLFMKPDEMLEHIGKLRDEETAKQAVYRIYESSTINRYTRQNYYLIFASSGMNIIYLKEICQTDRKNNQKNNEFYTLTKKQQSLLLNQYSKVDLSVCGFTIILQKNVNWP